jgi:hypothetical protein
MNFKSVLYCFVVYCGVRRNCKIIRQQTPRCWDLSLFGCVRRNIGSRWYTSYFNVVASDILGTYGIVAAGLYPAYKKSLPYVYSWQVTACCFTLGTLAHRLPATWFLTHWGRLGSFKLFKRPFPGFLTILTILNAELNPICCLLALLAHHFLHVSRIRVKSLNLRLLMSYIYVYIYIYIYILWADYLFF